MRKGRGGGPKGNKTWPFGVNWGAIRAERTAFFGSQLVRSQPEPRWEPAPLFLFVCVCVRVYDSFLSLFPWSFQLAFPPIWHAGRSGELRRCQSFWFGFFSICFWTGRFGVPAIERVRSSERSSSETAVAFGKKQIIDIDIILVYPRISSS